MVACVSRGRERNEYYATNVRGDPIVWGTLDHVLSVLEMYLLRWQAKDPNPGSRQ